MAILNIFDISGSAMRAQTVRLNTTASNLANAESVSSSVEDTYRARHPVFAAMLEHRLQSSTEGTEAGYAREAVFDDAYQSGSGVDIRGIVESQAPLDLRYEPNHPMADEDGYVAYPNVNVVEEMADMMSASRSFQLNVEVLNSAKRMAERVLTLGQ